MRELNYNEIDLINKEEFHNRSEQDVENRIDADLEELKDLCSLPLSECVKCQECRLDKKHPSIVIIESLLKWVMTR